MTSKFVEVEISAGDTVLGVWSDPVHVRPRESLVYVVDAPDGFTAAVKPQIMLPGSSEWMDFGDWEMDDNGLGWAGDGQFSIDETTSEAALIYRYLTSPIDANFRVGCAADGYTEGTFMVRAIHEV